MISGNLLAEDGEQRMFKLSKENRYMGSNSDDPEDWVRWLEKPVQVLKVLTSFISVHLLSCFNMFLLMLNCFGDIFGLIHHVLTGFRIHSF